MEGDLSSRLVRSGLVTRGRAKRARAGGAPGETATLERLIDGGLQETAAAGFFVAEGFGPLLRGEDLTPESPMLGHIPAALARTLIALPVRLGPAGLVVAMAAPSDEDAVRQLQVAAAVEVVPRVALLSQLRNRLELSYPAPALEEAPFELQRSTPPASAVIELVNLRPSRRPPGQAPEGEPWRSSTRGAERAEARILVGPERGQEEEAFLPLVRQKSSPTTETPAAAEKPAAAKKHETDREGARQATRPVYASASSSDASASGPVNKVGLSQRSALRESHPPKRAPQAPSLEDVLDGLTRCSARERALELVCHGSLRVAKSSVILALDGDTLRGWAGAGPKLVEATIRELTFPAGRASVLRDVLAEGTSYDGPHGKRPIDLRLRATLVSRGNRLAVVPVRAGTRLVALLAADEPRFGEAGLASLESLADALGSALARMKVPAERS